MGAISACGGTASSEERWDLHTEAMGSIQAIVSVVGACATVKDPSDGAEMQHRATIFASLAQQLLPLLTKLLHPDGIDFLEEALEILSDLTLYNSSPLPASLWGIFPHLFQCVCGHPTAPLEDGWAPDMMPSLLPPLVTFIVRGPPESLLAGVWAEGGLAYPEMIFKIFMKVIHMPGIGSEEDAASAARLAAAFFSNFSQPAIDTWMPRYLNEIGQRMQAVETQVLRHSILSALAAMLSYSAALFLRCTEERQRTRQVFEFWLQHIGSIKKLTDRKLHIIGFLRLLELSCQHSLPSAVVAGLPLVAQQLALQSREVMRLQAASNGDAEKLDGEQEDDDESDEGSFEDGLDFDDEKGCRGEDDQGSSKSVVLGCINELQLLRRLLRDAPEAFQRQLEAWLGAGAVPQWVAELDAALVKSTPGLLPQAQGSDFAMVG